MTLVILYRYFFCKYYKIFRTAVVNNFHQEHICQQVNQNNSLQLHSFPQGVIRGQDSSPSRGIIVWLEPSFYRHSPNMVPPTHPFYIFSECPYWQNLSNNIIPLKYQMKTKINSCSKVISSFLQN